MCPQCIPVHWTGDRNNSPEPAGGRDRKSGAPLPWSATFFEGLKPEMAVQFSAAARQALGETWQRLIGTEGDAWIELYSGTMPNSPDEPVREERLLARLSIEPRTMRAEMDNAVRSGDAGWCRVIATDGRAVADFDIGLKGQGATMNFNTLGIRKGGPVSVYGPVLDFFGMHPLTKDEQDERALRDY